LGVYVGLVDTDMGKFSDAPKSDPADVVRQVLDGIESGADEVLADDVTAVCVRNWASRFASEPTPDARPVGLLGADGHREC